MRVEFADEAREQLRTRRAWWVENRPEAAETFDEELATAQATLAARAASFPLLARRKGAGLRRILMPTTGCHLYFRVNEAREVVEVVSAWGARMGRLPSLAKGRP